MSKTKLLTILVVVLVLINIAAMTAFFVGGKRGPHKGPKKMIINKLDLDQNQTTEYEALIEDHQIKIREKEEALRTAKQNLFNLLQKNNYNEKDQLIEKIGQIHKEMDHIHFQHFTELKKICKPDQIEKFNALTNNLARSMATGNKKRHHPKH